MQVKPMKPKLKPPGSKRSKAKCEILLSTSAFKFNLRRYTSATMAPGGGGRWPADPVAAAAAATLRLRVLEAFAAMPGGGVLITITRPTLNLFLILRAFVRALTLKVPAKSCFDIGSEAGIQ
jgi:hypothetical protein